MKASRNETSRRDVAGNASLSKRNRDSSMQEGNRIKQGFEELAVRIVVEQDQDRFSARLEQFQSTVRRRKNKGLKSRAGPRTIPAESWLPHSHSIVPGGFDVMS